MITLRPNATLGSNDREWLKARLHIAIAGLGNPAHPPIGELIAWNDDEVAPLSGFPFHAHQDVEIVTYVCDGAITHKDSLGNQGTIKAGDLQVMSAGSGIRHSEWNAEDRTTRMFQIWLTPRHAGGVPRWQTKTVGMVGGRRQFDVLASGFEEQDGGPLWIGADARILGGRLAAQGSAVHILDAGKVVYLVPVRGQVSVNGILVNAGDGALIEGEPAVHVQALSATEVVMVEVADPEAGRKEASMQPVLGV